MEGIKWLVSKIKSKKFRKAAIILLIFAPIVVEIVPVKWCPISSLLKWVGKVANQEVIEKVDTLQDKVASLELEIGKVQYCNSEKNAIDCRVRILRFGDEVRLGLKHSKENFEQALADIDTYESYCYNHPEFKNNRTKLTIQKIKIAYEEAMDNNDFL